MRSYEKKWDLEEINFARRCVGLLPLKSKKKCCVKCSSVFLTTSHNICCNSCRRSNRANFEYYGEYGDNNTDV